MKIFFMGVTKISYTCFTTILEMGYEIAGCAYLPEDIEISFAPEGMKIYNYYDVETLAGQHGIVCIPYTRNDVQGFIRKVKQLKPDVILVAGWYYMVPKALRDVAPKGAIGLHASMLPKYKGGAPLVWAIINGETETGLSLFYLEDGVDAGNIIGQYAFSITDTDTIADLLLKTENAAVELLRENLPLIEQGTNPSIPQDKTLETYFPQRSPSDGLIDWNWPTKKIKDFIRAQTKPYPGAFTYYNNRKVIIWDADILDE